MGSASPRRRPGGRGLFAATLPRVLARSGGANRVAGRAAREDAIARRCGVRRRDVYFVLSVRRRPGQVPEVHGRDLEREGRAMDEARAQLPGRQPLLVAPGSSASQDARCSAEQVRTRPAPQRALRQAARARTRPQGRAPEVCNRGAAALPLRVQSRQAPARAHEDVRHDTPDAQTPRGAVSAGACGRPLAPQRTSREPHLCAVRVSTASAGASDAGRHRAAQPWPGGGARGCSRIPRKPSPQRRSFDPLSPGRLLLHELRDPHEWCFISETGAAKKRRACLQRNPCRGGGCVLARGTTTCPAWRVAGLPLSSDGQRKLAPRMPPDERLWVAQPCDVLG